MLQQFKNYLHFLNAFFACIFYGFPARKMKVIGVTGTSGKTTTTHLIYHILQRSGYKVSMVSTVEANISGKTYDTGFHVTTPSSWALQKFIKSAQKGGSEYFILEVTSHALDQYRVWGTSIDIAVVTNITHEHLDYHKTFENYKKIKAKIMNGADFSVLNMDELNFHFLKQKSSGKIVKYGIDRPADISLKDYDMKPLIPGKFNLYNCLAAASVASILGLEKSKVETAIADFKGIPGRMEEIKIRRNYRIFIDFAHKPDALEKALSACREMTRKRLIVVFGCAGLRDRLKRPIMGEIASKLSDVAILTAEDPRTEDVRDIIDEIAKGCVNGGMTFVDKRKRSLVEYKKVKRSFWKIPDRQEAINFAIRKLAGSGDTILITGKGHEKSMCYGNIEYPWDEKSAVEKALFGKG